MKYPMIVTNIRMAQPDYLQLKTTAAELGMSVNEYITKAGKIVSTYRSLFGLSNKRQNPYAAMWKTINKKVPRKPMGWSKEDEAIYSV